MNLLQALLCAGMHSRAAYGYAMAAGHLSSLLNFALLQTVGRLILAFPLCHDVSTCLGRACNAQLKVSRHKTLERDV